MPISGRLHSKRKYGTSGQSFYQIGDRTNSGSEDVYESSMESIDSTTVMSPGMVSGIGQSGNNTNHLLSPRDKSKQLHKISSADSLLTMIKNLSPLSKTNSVPCSPQEVRVRRTLHFLHRHVLCTFAFRCFLGF